MTQFLRILGGLLLAILMTACGGGGGSPGTTPVGGGGGGSGSGGGGSTPPAGGPTVVLSIVNAAGTASTRISLGGSYMARATLRDSAGAAVANRLVSFSVSNEAIAVVSPTSALTDASGLAQVAIAPASITSLGAATLTADATIDGGSVTGQVDFGVSSSSLTLSDIALGTANLPSGGNTSISVTALIDGAPSSGVPVNVSFVASCGRINGVGSSFSTTTNGSGVASAVYSAVNSDGSLCSGAVTLTASSAGTSARTASISVPAPVANAITFMTATPSQIYVAGSGALEQAVVKFKVLSGATPLANVAVRFSILVNPGGVGLNASGATADVTATTDAAGQVSASVFSGTIPGPVKVRASLVSDLTVFAETQDLNVSSGPPSQRFMSLSVGTFNIEGWNLDGTPTTLTVRIADRQGNPVENGTVVNFTAEGGQVASSCSTLKANGISSCSVDFISQNPRPASGRVSVLAFASGTKDYVDVNGNNQYDAGIDTLVQIGDAYRDDNENGAFEAGEFVVPRGGTVSCATAGWPFPSRADTCDSGLATTVRQQTVILFSSSNPWLELDTFNSSSAAFRLSSVDNPLLPLPAGTTVAVEMADATNDGLSCSLDKLLGSVVVNVPPSHDPSLSQATSHQATLKNCSSGDLMSIKVTVPSGLETIFVRTVP
jgi:hypothetical protein